MSASHADHPDSGQDPLTHWEQRYGAREGLWSGHVNAALASSVDGLGGRTALELGAGEGGDALWLAERGWTVTAVDISPTALARGQAAAERAGLGGAITWVAADLEDWRPEGRFDLVTACFLHSTVALDRERILHRAARWVAPSGHLLVVAHAEPPQWADPDHVAAWSAPQPRDDLAALDLDDTWEVLIADRRDRAAYGPDGEPAVLRDGVLLVRRD